MAVAAIQLRSIVSKLCNLLNNVDEYKLPQLVVEEIMIVKYKVTKIQDALNNYYLDPWLAHQKIDDIIDIFLVDWTEYTCDIDDKIDAFMLSVDANARAKPQRFRRWMTKAKKNHGNIATAIQDISAHIDEVLERLRNRCSLFSTEVCRAWTTPPDAQPDMITLDSRVLAKFEHASKLFGVMPNLQKLVLYFNVRKREGGWFDIGLENLTSLEHVTVIVDCDGAQMKAVEDAEIKLKNAIYIHQMSGVPKYDIFEKMLENILQDPSPTPISLSLEFLEAITDGFSRELGRGGYGVVYKGVLNSRNVIAVKKIFDKHLVEDNNQFQNEVINLVGRKHQNIVQLVGYCVESRSELVPLPCGKLVMAEVPKMLLCFEYISNRSLDEHVSDELSGFDWDSRYEIIKGICSGLHFLHEICHIVHLDLKPQNIMMDATMIPKIADFGLSRLLGEQKSRTIIKENPAGTLGYMAPEYLMRGEVSTKADIFSFGVIIIQIITGGSKVEEQI
ncbi:hypothetical protein PR202_ga11004 [Eleusine coracana subsp. coracana]|uniref:non-specific serine/threonine protein kinase n=1 Tax=Eleusine coracana subsp. coracana TaxID=191504 RepID=A0AAV5C804_ELECO|nr:hypothetical protein PR202_ga11004 [Eleusine coracana subsp. coracana]